MNKKRSGKGKIIAIIASACAAIAIAVVVIVNLCVTPAERVVVSFMDAFKREDFFTMRNLCDLDAFENEQFGIYSYASTNIIDYKIKSVSSPSKEYKYIIAKRYKSDSDKDFEDSKKRNEIVAHNDTMLYGVEYDLVEDSYSRYVLKSKEPVLTSYYVTLDVQYSTALGNVKRNSVSMTVCQKDYASEEYEITEMYGIIH